jgi:DNA-binding ferritin-like protein
MVTYKIGAEAEEEQTQTLTELVKCLLDSATITHIMHWQTESYAAHQALGMYYSDIPDLIDDVIEAYQGKTKIILRDFPVQTSTHEYDSPIEYMEYLSQELTEGRALFGEEPEIQNLVDAIADLIDSTMYKLRRFK